MHEVCRFDFFVHGEHYGSVELDGAAIGIFSRWHSQAYFCGACGEVWARVVQNRTTGVEHFWAVQRACEKHFDRWEVPGSVLSRDLEAFIPGLPEALALREAILHLNSYTGDDE